MEKLHELVNEFQEQNLLLPIWLQEEKLYVVNQKKLPNTKVAIAIQNVEELASAIKDMVIRGSGALGTCGAWGLYLAAIHSGGDKKFVTRAGELLKQTRPTAVNLVHTIDEILEQMNGHGIDLIQEVEMKTIEILKRQLSFEHRLGEYGAELIGDGDSILTHCHSGALAGSGYGGRALSVIRKAHEQGKNIHVYVSETRPYLQGARITAYELKEFGIPHTLLSDNMSGHCMKQGLIDKVIVGSDRVVRNGDLVNKVGTYMHALAAKANDVPFYTATSSHTMDDTISNGSEVEIEYRNPSEVTSIQEFRIAPEDTQALYPSFDITPHELIEGIITERGVIQAPYATNLRKVMAEEDSLV
ncbi:S-methyl-5-thioribose-1-phosphate isomerase [Thalassobacillus sp. B23F22_16]|uniref:S-methyl-5-thioribose-1-phosphate isomerase n=1 Tax=Thalassobacillus sp. B23F22_16 TaxID=3459513 RepID=UPI00373E33DD